MSNIAYYDEAIIVTAKNLVAKQMTSARCIDSAAMALANVFTDRHEAHINTKLTNFVGHFKARKAPFAQ